MSLHPTLRQDVYHLRGRQIALAPAMPALRRSSPIIVLDLDPSDWIDITLPVEMPVHVADAALKKDRV